MATKKTRKVNKKIPTHQKYITVVSKFDILESFVFQDFDILGLVLFLAEQFFKFGSFGEVQSVFFYEPGFKLV